MQELPPSLIAVLGLLAVGMAVLLVAWLVRYVGGSRDRSERSDADPSQPAASSPATPSVAGRETRAQSPQDHVLCVSRTDVGTASVTVQGKPYDRLRDIKDPAVGRLAVDAVKGVLNVTRIGDEAARPGLDDSSAPPKSKK